MEKKFFQAQVQCLHCGHVWPQVLNKPLQKIECYKCSKKGVHICFDSETDKARWQADNPDYESVFALLEEEYYASQDIQEHEVHELEEVREVLPPEFQEWLFTDYVPPEAQAVIKKKPAKKRNSQSKPRAKKKGSPDNQLNLFS